MKNPLSILLLLPALFSLYYVVRGYTEKAFLQLYLPALLGLPFYYACRLPHMPPISVAEAILIPIAFGTVIRSFSKWRFCRVDLWVVLFMCSLAASEVLRENILNDGIFVVLSAITSMLFPYIVGRLLIEPQLRLQTAKRFVVISLFLTLIGLYELRMGINPYSIIASKLFGFSHIEWTLQMRGGRARIATSFSDAELAGIVFTIAIALNWSLIQVNKLAHCRLDEPRGFFAKLQRWHLPGLILFGLLLLTQSRGPLLGAALAFAIIQIPKFKNTRRASIVMAVLLVLGGLAVYSYLDRYTASSNDGAASEQQASAAYRRLLLENYKPIVEEGGWLGWSTISRPQVRGQESVDNEFLLVQLIQGRLGLILFVLIGADTVWRLIQSTWRFRRREDLYFAFSLLAAMGALWFTITTVYLGEQLPQIAFLLIGWSQSLHETQDGRAEHLSAPEIARFNFKRVFV
ncbi:MAG TPA: O-antigen ligase family protein [Alloacidobacterium sp.]|jgi:hypothetical protein|nr:O-antigen ligase family protein [Alloacidobacterium sp.]